MEKSVKANSIPIRIVMLLCIFTGFIFEMKAETKKREVLETKEIAPHVYSVNDTFVNIFLVQDNDNYVVIDAGSNLAAISKELEKLKINSDKVVALFLTHTHGDHIAAINLFKNATIYLSKQEIQTSTGEKPATLTLNNKNFINAYRLLEDQQIVRVNNLKIQGIHTPGHTPGSMCYLINDNYLFVGDAFSLTGGKIDKPNEMYSKDMKTAIHSLAKIANLPKAEYIFTAHTGYSNDYKTAMTDWEKIKE